MATASLHSSSVAAAGISARCQQQQQARAFAAPRAGLSASPRGLGAATPLTPALKSKARSLARPQRVSRCEPRAAADVQQLRGAREAVKQLITSKECNPILIRLGWHDAGTYDYSIPNWGKAGGATGSIRFKPEIQHGANAGLDGAIGLLEPVKQKFPAVSYADLFQLASATAAELAGCPKIPMKYGRVDVASANECPEEGRLPSADPANPAEHLRQVFYRMGLNDQEIVALSGGHTMGRARPSRSGFGKDVTKYTESKGGGQSWTVDWLKFDNSYFKDLKAQTDGELLVLPTDAVLFQDPEFKKWAELYAQDEQAFFNDYCQAYKKLSEQGAKFDPPQGVTIDAPDYSDSRMSDSMKAKLRQEYVGFGGSPNQPLQSNPFLGIIIGVSVLAILAWLTGAV